MANDPEFLALATRDTDLGVLPANEARLAATEYANKTRQAVTLRDHLTDKLIATVRPSKH